MSDIATLWRPDAGVGDWAAPGTAMTWTDPFGATHDVVGDLLAGDELLTAVLISLFTDAEAGADDVIPDGSGDHRGWWAGPIGSRIWLRMRSKQTILVPALVKSDIADALAWMIADGVATAIDVTAEWTRVGVLGAEVVIRRVDGTSASLRFSSLWETI